MVEPKIAIGRILADLNLAVRYGIAIRIYASRNFGGFNLVVVILIAKSPNLIPRQIFRLYGNSVNLNLDNQYMYGPII